MITIVDLLEDSRYKEFFCQVPKLAVPPSPGIKPWRVFILLKKNHKWAQRDFATYPEAFRFFKKALKRGLIVDGAINCRRQSFSPPIRYARIKGKYVIGSDGVKRQATKRIEWQPKLGVDDFEDHQWCPWCRRPTVFKYYGKHRALKIGFPIDPSVPRCMICGASTRVTTYRRPA